MKGKLKEESATHKRLAAELISIIPELDEEGLSFLIEQARVHVYNMEVSRIEEEAAESDTANLNKKGDYAREPDKAPANFRIERSSSGSSYHLISGGKWKMYNEDEMMRIVKIASTSERVRDVAVRLHAWFAEERPDTFADLELGDACDPRLDELVVFLRSKFAIKTK